MDAERDQITIRYTDKTQALLKQMTDAKLFKELGDGYRFGMAFAAATGRIAPPDLKGLKTFLNIGSFDADGAIREAISELYPDDESPYHVVERLAEAGVAYLGERFRQGTLRFDEIFPAG